MLRFLFLLFASKIYSHWHKRHSKNDLNWKLPGNLVFWLCPVLIQLRLSQHRNWWRVLLLFSDVFCNFSDASNTLYPIRETNVCAACERFVVRNSLFFVYVRVCLWISQSQTSHTYVHQSIIRMSGHQIYSQCDLWIQNEFQQRNDTFEIEKNAQSWPNKLFIHSAWCVIPFISKVVFVWIGVRAVTVATYDNSTHNPKRKFSYDSYKSHL